jgi:flagellar hook-associated protein 2
LTFGGLASGIDTNSILQALLQVERQPLQGMQSNRDDVDNQRSLVRQLNTKLLALRDAASGLDNRNTSGTDQSTSEEFLKYQGTSTNDKVVQVTAGKGAAAGDIQVRVDQLARGSRRFSTAFTVDASKSEDASNATALQANQTITITLPNEKPSPDPKVLPTNITVTAGSTGMSLATLRDQINSADGNGGKVRANILQSSEGVYRLVLTSSETGTENELQVTGDLAMDAPAADGSDSAQNAKALILGKVVERQSNKIDDVLPGVTLDLKGVAALDDNHQPITETVTIGVDVDAISSSIDSFVGAYNDVIDFLDSQSKYDENAKKAGPLSGDSILRDIQTRLRKSVSDAYMFDEDPNNRFAISTTDEKSGKRAPGGSISGIGIKLVGNGKLELDKTVLTDALSADPLAVREFLSGLGIADGKEPLNKAQIDQANALNARPEVAKDPKLKVPVPEPDRWQDGFFTAFGAQLDDIVRSGDGLMAQRDNLFASRLKSIDDSIAGFNTRLAAREETLVQRFSSLETVISGLQNQQGFLSGIR